ncbi:hypothetical protein F3Y22_tig00003403pilonHSYRG00087 [Hibiscus syriacus]|uniref:Uncharacterized protein n=1 Tax=Hibiscus syriacus TaxID=106335 RepID=A0A6A3CK19_HIBSY|nr:hypothetical protein F3Y22_tig00003403pilonHSYRG00087 [Hibiscus syriacus]
MGSLRFGIVGFKVLIFPTTGGGGRKDEQSRRKALVRKSRMDGNKDDVFKCCLINPSIRHRSYPYKYKFTTQKGVNYYVRSTNFEQDYPVNSPECVRIEELVEREYYFVLA